MPQENNSLHPKIEEYANRVISGETIDSFGDIPDAWKKEIIDAAELKRLEQQKALKQKSDASKERDAEDAETIRRELGISNTVVPEQIINEYNEFRVKNGESDEGFFWYEYRNRKAKEMKEAGTFEWGKERIYFDVSIKDCDTLRDIVFSVAGENNIPIAFKFIDEKKTYPVHKDGTETRFVANFATSDDARTFYKALRENETYKRLTPDRTASYNGIRIDPLAEYASGYREKRGALARVMQATKNTEGQYEYFGESGKKMTISEEQFAMFKKQDEEMREALDNEEEKWQELREEV